MLLAIHNATSGFHPRWVNYCQENNIEYKLVDCYSNSIIKDLEGCTCLFWHPNHRSARDIVMSKELLFALQQTGFPVFPDFNTGWHFEDKVGQKYLFERIGLPFVPTYVFYSEKDALNWSREATFPKVFKLRGGAGSSNVKLARTKSDAVALIKKSFGKGFKHYEAKSILKERLRKYKNGDTNSIDLLKGVARLIIEPEYSKVIGREKGYVYFQEFIPNNTFDIRIIVIDGKAFGLKRMVRENDFRASGSGNMKYEREEFDERCVEISFSVAEKLKTQVAALDFVFDEEGRPLIVEISFGFTQEGYEECPGFWDSNLNWHEGKFNPQGWMIEAMIKSINQ